MADLRLIAYGSAIENGLASRKLDAATGGALLDLLTEALRRDATVETFIVEAARRGLIGWPRRGLWGR